MKNKQTVLNRIESARVQVESLKKGLEEKSISGEDILYKLNIVELMIDHMENLIDLEDDTF